MSNTDKDTETTERPNLTAWRARQYFHSAATARPGKRRGDLPKNVKY
jgi:hypothetical protein